MGPRSSIEELPGAELIVAGLRDLEAGEETVAALLVAMAAPRLRAVGIEVSASIERPSHRLYRLLAAESPASAHRRYNALVGRIVSFARAAEHARPG